MYRFACKHSDEVIFYFDAVGNKYVASGGALGWRINNPGLVRSRGHFSEGGKAIGCCGRYAIFPTPQEGHKALATWLRSKKYYNSPLKVLAEHYQPDAPEAFVSELSSLAKVSPTTRIKLLNKTEFDRLIFSIEKLCGYAPTGHETFSLLPKIIAKIENGKDRQDTYLIGNNIVLSKEEALQWILSHRLDGVIVHERKGSVHLRSRPDHCIWNIKTHESALAPSEGNIDVLARTVGEKKYGQCIWGFINGIDNTKEEALESAGRISLAAGGEAVFSMPNDTTPLCIKDGLVCVALKFIGDTPIVEWAVKFFRYLLNHSEKDETHPPVIIFAHSQGTIITEHALELLDEQERKRLLIFTFGGGSFIAPGKSHPDSHNYASAKDLVCSMGSPNLQYLALQRYFGRKEGRSEQDVVYQLSLQDAMFDLDSVDPETIESYAKQRAKHYEKELPKIRNVTVLDPDPKWRHRFESNCYQSTVQMIVKKYRQN